MVKQPNKKYKLQKESKYKEIKDNILNFIKTKKHLIFYIALGTIVAFTGTNLYKKLSTRKEINNTSFSKILDMTKDNTCLDEVLTNESTLNIYMTEEELKNYTNALDEINVLERQLSVSEQLEKINFDKFGTELSEEKIDYSEITVDDIEKDLELYNKYLTKIKNDELDLNVPSKETQEFKTLLYRMKNQDIHACNGCIFDGYNRIYNLYILTVKSKFLDKCGLNENNITDIEFDYDRKFEELDNGNLYIEYKYLLKYADEYYKLEGNLAGEFLDDITVNHDKGKSSRLEVLPIYNPARNKFIEKGLNEIKRIILSDLEFASDNTISYNFDYKTYQKLKK